MMRRLPGILGAIAMAMAAVSPAFCATIQGVVHTTDGKLVSGAKIAVTTFMRAGTVAAPSRALSRIVQIAADGSYVVRDLPPGDYSLKLQPESASFRGGEGVVALASNGLTVDWVVSKTAEALAFATPGLQYAQGEPALAANGALTQVVGGTLGGISTTALVVGGSVVVIGGVVGGIAAAGGFSGSSSTSSPAL